MNCMHCGTAVTRVLETRSWFEGALLKRRRECAYGHRFTTVETFETKTIAKHAGNGAKVSISRDKYRIRDKAIVNQYRSGKKRKDVAKFFDITPKAVYWVISKQAPELLRIKTPKEKKQ